LQAGHLCNGQNSGETTAGVKLIFLEKIEKNLFLGSVN